jgi:molecular chaperone DnaK
LDEAVESAKNALKSGEPADITEALENLSQAYSAAGASLYQEAQAQPEGEASPEDGEAASDAGGGDDDVVEADYEIVDEKEDTKE